VASVGAIAVQAEVIAVQAVVIAVQTGVVVAPAGVLLVQLVAESPLAGQRVVVEAELVLVALDLVVVVVEVGPIEATDLLVVVEQLRVFVGEDSR